MRDGSLPAILLDTNGINNGIKTYKNNHVYEYHCMARVE